jgi:Na+/H+ antiporter NhaD/arsenite permease-like protein
MTAALTILVFIAAFTAMYRASAGSHVAVLAGAAAVMMIGTMSGTYSLRMAVDAIYFETLALIFGMSAISTLLARSGVFVYLAAGTAEHSKGNVTWVLVMMSLVTYGISLTTNNIATMVVVLPITLNICYRMQINPVPLTVAELFAANLGGASTMIGDFPNMIIASAGNLHFNDFISGMMVPCLVLLAGSLLFFEAKMDRWSGAASAGYAQALDQDEVLAPTVDKAMLWTGIWIFGAAVAGFVFAGILNVRPGWIAFIAGLGAMAVGRFKDEDAFHAYGGHDILFFIGLFVMVGGLMAAGILEWLTWLIESVGSRQDGTRAVVLMWVVAGLTLFVGGGTTAAVFAPVAASLSLGYENQASWWAVSLGIMAGSSGALSGATSGSLVMSHYERFIARHPEMLKAIPSGQGLTHREYMRWAMPLTGLFLLASTIYIAAIAG